MTQNEKKASNSEIPADGFYDISLQICYQIIYDARHLDYSIPFDGYANILYTESSGTSTYILNETSYFIRAGENILHQVNKDDRLEWKSPCENSIAVIIFIQKNTLTTLDDILDRHKERFGDGILTKSDHRLTLSIQKLIALSQQKNSTLSNDLYIQSLILESVAHQIEGLYAENENQELIVNKNHYDKIVQAKKIIDSDLTKSYTINELAKMVGTNEQYLKQYFKQQYGKTIMSYITEAKMEHARALIMTGNHRIADVARMTGYKHATHFTTAFKKFYGFIPNSLRYTFLVAHEGGIQILADLSNIAGLL